MLVGKQENFALEFTFDEFLIRHLLLRDVLLFTSIDFLMGGQNRILTECIKTFIKSSMR